MPLLSSRFLDVREDGDHFSFCLRRCFDERLALRLRHHEARRKVRLRLKSIGDITVFSTDAMFRVAPHVTVRFEAIAAIRERIDRDLAAIAERPMTSHEVQEALQITAKERIRWTKDNRLRACGTITARRQQVMTFRVYAPAYIQELSGQPEIIEAWRNADRASEIHSVGCEAS
jgi:hypothetical protein